ACSAMRRPPQLGRKPRRLQENGDEPLEGAVVAAHAGEAPREHAARQELAELALDESGETATVGAVGDLAQEGFQVVADEAMEDRVLRGPRLIGGGAHARRGSQVCAVRGRCEGRLDPPPATVAVRGQGRGQWRGPSRGAKSTVVERREAVIIGAGPAGAATALRLAALAPELAAGMPLPDKARPPPATTGAGGLHPQATR